MATEPVDEEALARLGEMAASRGAGFDSDGLKHPGRLSRHIGARWH